MSLFSSYFVLIRYALNFNDRYVAFFVPLPRFETISKIRGTNFDAGGVKPLPSFPHVPCLFPPLQDTPLVLRIFCTWLSCLDWNWELMCCLVGLHLPLDNAWCNISRFNFSSHRKWPPSPPHFIPGDTNHKK